MSTVFDPVLFQVVDEIRETGAGDAPLANDWTDLANALVEDTNYAHAGMSDSANFRTWSIQLSDPDFPTVPAGELPVWFKVTYFVTSFDGGGFSSTGMDCRIAGGTWRGMFNATSPDFDEVSLEGFLSDWGISQQDALDIVAGTAAIDMYGSDNKQGPSLRVAWAKLEMITQQPQTSIRTPVLTF